MTAISAHRSLTRATAFERILLRTAEALDLFVAARLERRNSAPHRRAVEAQTSFAAQRRIAQSQGSWGLLPR